MDMLNSAPRQALSQAGQFLMPYTHVHIGAGRFGLGMVLDICRQAGFETVVLNRAVDRTAEKRFHSILREKTSYKIVYDDNPSDWQQIRVDFHYYQNDADTRAIDLISAPSAILLTTSVTPEGLKGVAPLIALAVEMRKANDAGPLCVIACENLQLNSEKLREYVEFQLSADTKESYFRNQVLFCNTVVDRVCADINEVGGSVEVAVEKFCEWIIEQPPIPIEAIRRLSLAEGVNVAQNRSEFEAYETRKYWCLNGSHLAAAAYAYNYDDTVVLLSEALRRRDVLEKVGALQNELARAFRCYAQSKRLLDVFPEDQVREYNENVLRRFRANTTDEIGRILKHADRKMETLIRSFIRSLLEVGVPRSKDARIGDTSKEEENLRGRIRRTARGKLLGVLQLPDLHAFLDRVVERIVGPQRELVSFYEQRGETSRRLQLDDALQTIVIATSKYATKAHKDIEELVTISLE